MSPSDAFTWSLAAQALLFVLLSLRVIQLRLSRKVGIGDGGDRDLKRAIRVHGNWVEWVPLTLLLLLVADLRGSPPAWIAGLGATLLVARLGHVLGLTRSVGLSVGRSGGIFLNVSVILAAAALAVLAG